MLTFAQFLNEALTEEYKPFVKGWMSPSGKPHIFDPTQEHDANWHPSYRGKRGIHTAQKAGFVRFGSGSLPDGRAQHYINYHADHSKGKLTALRAARYLKPGASDEVTFHGYHDKGPDSYEKVSASTL